MSRLHRNRPGEIGTDFEAFEAVTRLLANRFTDSILAANPNAGHVVRLARIENDSASQVVVGLGHSLLNSKWLAGQWDNDAGAGSEFINDTTDAQDAGANDFRMEFVGTNNDGFVVAAPERFSALVITVGTATVDAGAYAREWTYWNGTTWSAFTPLSETTPAPGFVAGRHEVVFEPPADWTATTGAAGEGGIGTGYFAVRFRATTAPDTTAGLATVIGVWDVLEVVVSQVPANTTATLVDSDSGLPLTDQNEALVSFISVGDAGNLINVLAEAVIRVGTRGE